MIGYRQPGSDDLYTHERLHSNTPKLRGEWQLQKSVLKTGKGM